MLSDDRSFDDGTLLAQSIRALAIQARRTLRQSANSVDARQLLREIDALQNETRARSSDELSKWLASLRKQVEDHAMALA